MLIENKIKGSVFINDSKLKEILYFLRKQRKMKVVFNGHFNQES